MSATETPQASVNRYSGRPADCDLTIVILWSKLGTPAALITLNAGTAHATNQARSGNWRMRGRPAKRSGSIGAPRNRASTSTIRHFETKRGALQRGQDVLPGFTNPDGSLVSGFNAYADPMAFKELNEKHLEFPVALGSK